MQNSHINISAPNLLNICVDQRTEGRIGGRLYHCYRKEPVVFDDVVELIREAEKLFDTIGFPQASTMTRSFAEVKETVADGFGAAKPRMVRSQQEILEYTGENGTFVTNVRFRQNATWQGEVYRMETEEMKRFSNTLDFIKMLDAEI